MNKQVIPYILAGYPDLQTTEELLRHCYQIGIRYIELGLPFSDPSADGPIIQVAAAQACQHFDLNDLLIMLHRLKKDGVHLELTLMTYANPIFSYGIHDLLSFFGDVGVKGLLIPDIPFEEREFILHHFEKNTSIKLVWMISENLSDAQLRSITHHAHYYLYLVSYLGTTGKTISGHARLKEVVSTIKAVKNIPVAVGFGIKNKTDVQTILAFADGAVIGTSLIEALQKGGLPVAREFLGQLIDSRLGHA
ncbi:MAG: tryptophan synthase subunit alpha [Candidatus Margulisiibacteriota bacterium]